MTQIETMYKILNRKRTYYFRKCLENGMKGYIDAGIQGGGKTTYATRKCVNEFWITICYISQHEKSAEIYNDLRYNPTTINPKLKIFVRVLSMFGKNFELTDNLKEVCLEEFPEYKNEKYLCSAYKHGEQGERIIELRKQGNLPEGYCRYRKKKNEDSTSSCPYRHECLSIKQVHKIIRKIKGEELMKLENKKNKSPKDIEKIHQLIEKQKKIDWLILLPHSYISNVYTEKIFEAFKNEFYKKDIVATIIDESILGLSHKILEFTKFGRNGLYTIVKFFKNELKGHRDNTDLFGLYNEFEELLVHFINNITFSRKESEEYSKLDDKEKRTFEESIKVKKIEKIYTELIKFINKIKKKSPDKYISYLYELNHNYLKALRSIYAKFPRNIFKDFISIIEDINELNDQENIKRKMNIKLKEGIFSYPLKEVSGINYLIDNSKTIIFADATGMKEIYKKIIPDYYDKFYFIERKYSSNLRVYCLKDKSKNFKYHLYGSVYRDGYWENDFKPKFYELIDYTAWLIKWRKDKKILIALYKDFNNSKKDEDKWRGHMMKILKEILKKEYDLDYRELDIKLGFWHAERGKNKFEDREMTIFFGLPGASADVTKIISELFNLEKKIVKEHFGHKEQEQMGERCRSLKSLIPKELFILADIFVISPFFIKEKKPLKTISNSLKHRKLIDYIYKNGSLITKEIRERLYKKTSLNSLRQTLTRIVDENFLLKNKIVKSQNSRYEYKWFT